ncbi:MAG: DUF4418 family protein [Sphaerochaeta sp.]
MKKKLLSDILTCAVFILSIFLAVGSVSIFHACGPKADGDFMICHWAERTVTAMGCVISVISLIALLSGKNMGQRKGALLSTLPCLIMTAFVPNNIIRLCMMETMRCHTVMKPAVIGIVIVIFTVAVIAVFVSRDTKAAGAERRG